jgi:thioredoxin 1
MSKGSSSKKKKKRIQPAVLRNRATGGGAVSVSSIEEFESHLDAPEPVIVDFWAPWCGPCKMMGPPFEAVAEEFAGKVRFLKVNTEQLPDLSGAFGIRSIPTLLVLHGREVTNSNIGVTSQPALSRMAQKALDRGEGISMGSRLRRWFGGSAPASM